MYLELLQCKNHLETFVNIEKGEINTLNFDDPRTVEVEGMAITWSASLSCLIIPC